MANPVGRPRASIDWALFGRLCFLQCTKEEIAHALDIHIDTLLRACKREKGMDFSTLFEKESAGGKTSLRRFQYDAAKKGSAAMLIWLGKQWLGQRDVQRVETLVPQVPEGPKLTATEEAERTKERYEAFKAAQVPVTILIKE